MTLGDLFELSDAAPAVPEATTFEAIIARDADGINPVFVVIPDFDRDLLLGPAPWSPVVRADGLYYPKRGDRAVIVRPTPASVWIVTWTPAATEADENRWFADFEESE